MKRIVERHGGSVEKFIGDAVMAVFGVRRVTEITPSRRFRPRATIRRAGYRSRVGAGYDRRRPSLSHAARPRVACASSCGRPRRSSADRWVDAYTSWPRPLGITWRTTRGHVDAVRAHVTDRLTRGYEDLTPEHAELVEMTNPGGYAS